MVPSEKFLYLMSLALFVSASAFNSNAASGDTQPPSADEKHSIWVGMPYEMALALLKSHPQTVSLNEGDRQLLFPDKKPRRMHTAQLANGKDTLLVIGVAEKEGAPYKLESISYEPNSVPACPKRMRDASIEMSSYPSSRVPTDR